MQMLLIAVLAIVQGLTEFLPVSSSGHLVLLQKLFASFGYQQQDPLTLEIMLHMGTLLAVAIIFWKDWLEMLRHPVKNPTLRLLFIASLPALIIVLLFDEAIEGFFTGWFLAPSFFITALFLCLVELLEKKGRHSGGREEVHVPDAIRMGLFQGVALLPGVSRSGSTLLGGVLGGLSRRSAAKFSFMMSAPAIFGGFLMKSKDAIERGGLSSLFGVEILLGTALAALCGWLAIRYMLRLIERISFYRFAIYVALVGILVIVLIVMRVPGFEWEVLKGAIPAA